MGSTAARLALIVVIAGLSACGFSLRGGDALSGYDSLQLALAEPNGEFARLLLRSLDSSGVSTDIVAVDSASPDSPLLGVGAERVASRPVTVNPRARAAQYEIRLSVDILLRQGDNELIPLETLSQERTYFEDIENIAGNQEEVQIITAEMRRELANQLLRRLQAARPRQ